MKGYRSTSDVLPAIERGEVEGMCGWGWDSARVNGRDYFARGVISVGLECANERHPELAARGVPFMMDLTKDEETKKVLSFLFSYLVFIRPFVAPPGIPADRLKALQDAFAATLKDPDLLAEADRAGVEIRYASPERVHRRSTTSSTRRRRSRRARSMSCARPAGKIGAVAATTHRRAMATTQSTDRDKDPRSRSSAAARRGCCSPTCSTATASTASCWNGRAARMCCSASARVCWSAGTVGLLRDVGLGARMDREGPIARRHRASRGQGRRRFFIDTKKHTGKQMMAYGQTAITEDLYAARDAAGGRIVDEAANVQLHDADHRSGRTSPMCKTAAPHRIDCDFIAGCDGYHGVSRRSIPAGVLRTYEKALSVRLARDHVGDAAAVRDIIYCLSLARLRARIACATRCSAATTSSATSTTRSRTGPTSASGRSSRRVSRQTWPTQIVTGPSIEKSIAPLRSFVAEPMRYGRLFLAGDAAHIVPPTGAKGLNLAVSDVFYLSRALIAALSRQRTTHYLDGYSDMALRRVWSAARLSWWLTMLIHRFPDDSRSTCGRARTSSTICTPPARPGLAGGAICRPAVRGLR